MVLPSSFYQRNDVTQIAKELLGKILITTIDNQTTSGIIVETEAYAGAIDKASHAFGNRRTNRTEIMYREGGVAYVYLCYGIHHLFNVVTNVEDTPHAVLIRAVEPLLGVDVMMQRRRKEKISFTLTAGPGALSEALGIKTIHSGLNLQAPPISILDDRLILPKDIVSATRVGVAYAAEDALLPYRYFIKGNKWVSKGKGL